jgi:hypothetical protein
MPKSRRAKLDKMSRVDFSRFYTVEHNVKVFDFGDVDRSHLGRLQSQWITIITNGAPASLEGHEEEEQKDHDYDYCDDEDDPYEVEDQYRGELSCSKGSEWNQLVPAWANGHREISQDDARKLFTRLVQINVHGNWQTAVARLDTGSDWNCISHAKAQSWGILVEMFGEAVDLVLANGVGATAEGEALLEWKVRGESDTRVSNFYIMSGLPTDVIIGVHEYCKIGALNLGLPSDLESQAMLAPIFSSKTKGPSFLHDAIQV